MERKGLFGFSGVWRLGLVRARESCLAHNGTTRVGHSRESWLQDIWGTRKTE
jgi:hypothetical protein